MQLKHCIEKMVQSFSTNSEQEKKSEMLIALPEQFGISVVPKPLPPLDQLVPSEDLIKVIALRDLVPGESVSATTGSLRVITLPQLPYLSRDDIRNRFGAIDMEGPDGRVTNWVRLVKLTPIPEDVNVKVTLRDGQIVFDVIFPIPAGTEITVSPYEPTPPTELNHKNIYNTVMHQDFDAYRNYLNDKPLDLSTDKSSNPSSPQPCSSSEADSGNSSDSDASVVSPLPSPTTQIPQLNYPIASPIFARNMNMAAFAASLALNEHFISTPYAHYMQHGSLPNIPIITMETEGQKPCPSPPQKKQRPLLPCPQCAKPFDRPSLLKRHIRTHTGEKPHVCEVCGKGFSTSSSLNTHRRIHSGEKPHQCGVCGKRFTASSNLYYHKLTHTKEKPHKCTVCPRSFPTPGDLRSHSFIHTGQYPHKCEICGKGFSKLNNLRNHSLLHSSKNRMPRSPPSGSI